MNKSLTVILIAFAFVAGLQAQTVESQNVVGFFKVDIQSNAYNLISVPMQKLTVHTGQISANTTTDIVDDQASWSVDEFAMGADTTGRPYAEPGFSSFYMEITAPTGGAYYGRHYYVTNNTANTLTVVGGDFGAAALVGASYKIVPANRIRDIFGEPLTSSVLVGGSSFFDGSKDEVLFWTGSGWNIAWLHTGVAYKIGFATVSDDAVIDRDEGCFVRRRSGSTNLVVTGEVSPSSQGVPIAGAGQYNLIGGQAVVDRAIGDMNLEDVVVKGASFFDGGKSEVLSWNGAGWDILWCRASDTNWISGFSTVVTSTYMLDAGKGYFIKHTGADNTMTLASPLE